MLRFSTFHIIICLVVISESSVIKQEYERDTLIDAGKLGKIRGILSRTLNTDREFVQYLGIPYAVSPTGERRFMPSELNNGPLSYDDGTPFNATNFGAQCVQANGGIEDCLFLNIATASSYSGQKDFAKLAPVIVYIHGAAFVRGNANKFLGHRLLRNGLVVVSFNYRLGVFGYFGLNCDSTPGNAALYDALLVLQWVQRYIRYFGGNPNLVTIAGQSSGSASVTHLLMSPLSKGLFHRAIALSGTALNDWATTTNSLSGSLRIAQLTNCNNYSLVENSAKKNLDTISSCMKLATTEQLLQAQNKYQAEERKAGRHGYYALNPSVTFDNLKTVPTLLPDFPLNILKRKEQMNVPLLIGATKQDGEFALVLIYFNFILPNRLENNSTYMSELFVSEMISSVGFYPGNNISKDAFAQAYLGDCRKLGNFTLMLPGLTDIATVLFFKAAALQMAQLHSNCNSTYLYSFDFKGTHTQHSPVIPFPGGVAHSDDTIYLFPVQNFTFNDDENRVSNTLIDYWDNFAKTGSPGTSELNPEWPEFKDVNEKYLIIDKIVTIDNNYQAKWIAASHRIFGPNYCYS